MLRSINFTSGAPPGRRISNFSVGLLAFVVAIVIGAVHFLGHLGRDKDVSVTFSEIESRAKFGILELVVAFALGLLAIIGVVLGSTTSPTEVSGVIFSVTIALVLMTVAGLIATARGSVSARFRTRQGFIGAAPIC